MAVDQEALETGASALSAVLSIATGKQVTVTADHLLKIAPAAKKIGHKLIESIAIHAHQALERSPDTKE